MNKAIVILTAIFAVSVAQAYELGTHARTTQAAYTKSALMTNTTLLNDLGIQVGDNPFGEKYYDISGTTVTERGVVDDFELKYIPSSAKPLSISGWLMRGAVREDDAEGEENPPDPVSPTLKRPLHHFYDPYYNRPLTVVGLSLLDSDVHSAAAWAIGGRDPFAQLNTPESNRRNHFTVFDAREAMYRALTGRDSQGNVVAATEVERNKYWATTFRALGDVSHLVQDMGQPQHTRNDPHSGKGPAVVQSMLTGNKSVFEAYLEARATGSGSYSIDGVTVKPLAPLNYIGDPLPNGYPIPAFTKYSDYWSTREGTSGRGLADYSNRGFFSAGTNLGGNSFPSPSNIATNYVPLPAGDLLPARPGTTINFLKGDVNDFNQNSVAKDVRMTTESAFDAFLFTRKTYSLNRFNYDDMANLLIPRAVAYSAGMINYFFRGKLDYVDDPINAGKHIIKNLGTESITGSFTLYYDAVDGKRYPVAGDMPNETWSNRTIDASQQLENLSFTPPTNPAPKTSDVYMLVFKGNMGEEKAGSGAVGAVAAKLIQPVGATDYVAMSMPNPVPYRGVSIGVVEGKPKVSPYVKTNPSDSTPWAYVSYSGGNRILAAGGTTGGWEGGSYEGAMIGSDGSRVVFGTWSSQGIPFVAASGTLDVYLSPQGSDFALGFIITAGWDGHGHTIGNATIVCPTYTNVTNANAANYAVALAAAAAENSKNIYQPTTYVMASDGTVLASLAMGSLTQTPVGFEGSPYINLYYSGGQLATEVWNGGGVLPYGRVFQYSSPPNNQTYRHDGDLTFNVPDDSLYPVPPTASARYYPNPYNLPLPAGTLTSWDADWRAGVTAYNVRRKAWFLKNSTEFIAALKGGFKPGTPGVTRAELQTGALPASWDYQIKTQISKGYSSIILADGSHPGRHTKMPIVMSITYVDAVLSDTTNGGVQNGTKTTKRTTTFAYTDAAGRAWSVPVEGTQEAVLTYYTNTPNSSPTNRTTYTNWYLPNSGYLGSAVYRTQQMFLRDQQPNSMLGLLWSGVQQDGNYYADSTSGSPTSALNVVSSTPTYPRNSIDLTATAPDIFLQYHNTVLPQYVKDTAQSSTVMNNSAMYGVTEVNISPVGLIANGAGNAPAGTALGIFADTVTPLPNDGNQVEIYGTAVYKFDWQTGALTFKQWNPLLDSSGNEVASKIVTLPAGVLWSSSGLGNAIITYKGLHWPDVIEAINLRDADAANGTFAYSKPAWYELVKAVKAR